MKASLQVLLCCYVQFHGNFADKMLYLLTRFAVKGKSLRCWSVIKRQKLFSVKPFLWSLVELHGMWERQVSIISHFIEAWNYGSLIGLSFSALEINKMKNMQLVIFQKKFYLFCSLSSVQKLPNCPDTYTETFIILALMRVSLLNNK